FKRVYRKIYFHFAERSSETPPLRWGKNQNFRIAFTFRFCYFTVKALFIVVPAYGIRHYSSLTQRRQ
ncbi:MAG: hypothetical protein IIV60_05930, partial [Alistipes sp.]|nr:hypothetical protein [Alistipes sp.]